MNRCFVAGHVPREQSPWTDNAEGSAPLASLLELGQHLLPGTLVGISSVAHADVCTTVAGSNPLVFGLDELQRALDEGPTVTAIREGHTVVVDDIESEHRWPRFIPKAFDLGLRSYLGVPISVADTTLGALNLYSTVHRSVDAARLVQATLLATQAATTLEASSREDDLRQALRSSGTVGTAVGLIMERLHVDDEDAYSLLVTWSEKCSHTVAGVAEDLLHEANELRRLPEAIVTRDQHGPGLRLVRPNDPDEARRRALTTGYLPQTT